MITPEYICRRINRLKSHYDCYMLYMYLTSQDTDPLYATNCLTPIILNYYHHLKWWQFIKRRHLLMLIKVRAEQVSTWNPSTHDYQP